MAKRRAARGRTEAQSPRDEARSERASDTVTAVERAEAALREAQRAYDRACEAATEQAARAKKLTAGDLIDGTLEFTRRYPAAGLLAAGLIGFLLGRGKRR